MTTGKPHTAEPDMRATTDTGDGQEMPHPADPIWAVMHPDPYPYYAQQVARGAVERHEQLGLWVASSAADITAVLSSGLCGVRPTDEPVPKTLLGSVAGDLFGRFVRMNDRPGHGAMKQAVHGAMNTLDPKKVAKIAGACATQLLDGHPPDEAPLWIDRFCADLPVACIATLLGLPADQLKATATDVGDFVRCVTPGGTQVAMESGKEAASRLRDRLRSLRPSRSSERDPLLEQIAKAARAQGLEDPEWRTANAIGLMVQSRDATAGLIGNTLLRLAADPEAREFARAHDVLTPLLREVLRHDAPIQNTRRYVVRDGFVAGRAMRAGDAILVVLAAANRDPAANPDPDRFDKFRQNRRCFTFGLGVHECPGQLLALAVAQAGVTRLLQAGVDLARLARQHSYRASANARIPIFG